MNKAKQLLFLLICSFLLSCEKDVPFCYECKTYLNDELLLTSSGCGMTNEHLHTLQVGMESEAKMILGYEAKVICQRK